MQQDGKIGNLRKKGLSQNPTFNYFKNCYFDVGFMGINIKSISNIALTSAQVSIYLGMQLRETWV